MLPFISMSADEPDYKKWEEHEVKALYIEVDDKEDADIEEDGRFFQKYRGLSSGKYEVEVSEKVTAKLWKIRGTRYYMLFRFNPFLFRHDEGLLDWDGYDGTFYKEP